MAIPTILNPVEGHIGPPGHVREPPSEHKISSGNVCFRVTQTFGSLEGYYKGVAHGAVDIGNYHCGDKIYAPFDCTARSFVDGAGAIGTRFQHVSGWLVEVWHQDQTFIPYDRWVPVKARQVTGVVGDTGLGAICHAHLELKKDGKRYDIWQYLAQNIEEDVRDLPTGAKHLAQGKVGVGNRLREEANLTSTFYQITPEDGTQFVSIYATIPGQAEWPAGSGDTLWLLVGWRGKFWKIHHRLVTEITVTPSGKEILPAEDTAFKARVATAIQGAINALEAAIAALRSALEGLKN